MHACNMAELKIYEVVHLVQKISEIEMEEVESYVPPCSKGSLT